MKVVTTDPLDTDVGSSKRSGNASSDRLLALLMTLAERVEPWSVDELSETMGLPHSTTYRYVKSLADVGLIVAVSAGSYILGPSIIMLDRQMRLSDPLLMAAAKVKERLVAELPAPGTLLVCRLFRDRVMCVDSAESGSLDFEVRYARGRGLPLFRGAASKVILAHMPLRTVKGYFDDDPGVFAGAHLGSTWTEVKTSLREIRRTETAITHGELDAGAIGIASPILDSDDHIVGSLGYVVRASDHGSDVALEVISFAMRSGAREIRKSLQPHPARS